MTPNHFSIEDIKQEFWHWFFTLYVEQHGEEAAEILYCEIFKRTGGQVPWLAYEPIRLARDKCIELGQDPPPHMAPQLSARQLARIKNNS